MMEVHMHLTDTMRFRATPEFHDAIKAIASKRLISVSAYVRQAVVEQLRRDSEQRAMAAQG